MSAAIIEGLKKSESDAKQAAIDLAISIVEGVSPKQAAVERACQAAFVSASQFAELLETLTARKAAEDAYQPEELAAEIKQLSKEQDQIERDRRDAKQQIEKAHASLKEASSRSEAVSQKKRILEDRLQKGGRELLDTLDATGDHEDWRGVTLPVGENAGRLRAGRDARVAKSTNVGWKPSMAR